jgi:hypothetical protein
VKQLLLACAFFAAGCATMVNRPVEQIPVSSDPAGAVVSVDCGNAPLYGGTTPTVIEVPRAAESCSITVAKEGYAERRVEFERQISKATRANQVPGVIAGTIFSVAALALVWDTDDLDFIVDAYQGGHYIAAEAGNAVDRKTGAAYKWVPGRVDVKLEPLPPEQ